MKDKKTPKPTSDSEVGVEKLVRLPLRIWNGIKIGFWVMWHNELLAENMFKMLNDLLQLILKVSFEDKHYMTEIVITNPDTKAKQPIVHIWAGAGVNAEPHKRIKELIEENEALKERLRSA